MIEHAASCSFNETLRLHLKQFLLFFFATATTYRYNQNHHYVYICLCLRFLVSILNNKKCTFIKTLVDKSAFYIIKLSGAPLRINNYPLPSSDQTTKEQFKLLPDPFLSCNNSTHHGGFRVCRPRGLTKYPKSRKPLRFDCIDKSPHTLLYIFSKSKQFHSFYPPMSFLFIFVNFISLKRAKKHHKKLCFIKTYVSDFWKLLYHGLINVL